MDIPSGFLGDWWGVFWDVYNAKHNEVLASKEAQVYDNVSLIRASLLYIVLIILLSVHCHASQST